MNYSYSYDYDYSPYMAGFSAGWTVFSLLIGALMLASLWFLFVKAGEPGWAAIIPVYNSFELFKITWGNGWMFLLLLIPIANIVIGIMTYIKLAQAFGKGGGWACGLIFLSFIFLPIMAFSKDIVYVGAPGNPAPAAGAYQNPYQQQGYQNPYQQQGYQAPQQGYQAPQQGYQAPQQGYQPPQQPTYQQSAQNSQYYYQQTPAQSAPKYCAGCGTQLENNEKYCPKCGKPQ